jgi:G:T-mismatch repair DNA endonuclease (very short patch repair protein)
MPKSNIAFWEEKFSRNMARDERVVQELKQNGWRVFIVWECDLKSAIRFETAILNLAANIKSYGQSSIEQSRKIAKMAEPTPETNRRL